jgi:hypothetical protein
MSYFSMNSGGSPLDQLSELVFVEMQKRKVETGQGLWHFKNNLDKTYYKLVNASDSINQGKLGQLTKSHHIISYRESNNYLLF